MGGLHPPISQFNNPTIGGSHPASARLAGEPQQPFGTDPILNLAYTGKPDEIDLKVVEFFFVGGDSLDVAQRDIIIDDEIVTTETVSAPLHAITDRNGGFVFPVSPLVRLELGLG